MKFESFYSPPENHEISEPLSQALIIDDSEELYRTMSLDSSSSPEEAPEGSESLPQELSRGEESERLFQERIRDLPVWAFRENTTQKDYIAHEFHQRKITEALSTMKERNPDIQKDYDEYIHRLKNSPFETSCALQDYFEGYAAALGKSDREIREYEQELEETGKPIKKEELDRIIDITPLPSNPLKSIFPTVIRNSNTVHKFRQYSTEYLEGEHAKAELTKYSDGSIYITVKFDHEAYDGGSGKWEFYSSSRLQEVFQNALLTPDELEEIQRSTESAVPSPDKPQL